MSSPGTMNSGLAAMPAGMPAGLPRLRTRQAPRGGAKQVSSPVPMGGKPWYHGVSDVQADGVGCDGAGVAPAACCC